MHSGKIPEKFLKNSGIMTFQTEKNASKLVGMDIANKHVFPYTY